MLRIHLLVVVAFHYENLSMQYTEIFKIVTGRRGCVPVFSSRLDFTVTPVTCAISGFAIFC